MSFLSSVICSLVSVMIDKSVGELPADSIITISTLRGKDLITVTDHGRNHIHCFHLLPAAVE